MPPTQRTVSAGRGAGRRWNTWAGSVPTVGTIDAQVNSGTNPARMRAVCGGWVADGAELATSGDGVQLDGVGGA